MVHLTLMEEKIITSLEQVTPEWLTAVLTHSGALTQGTVVGFDVTCGRGNWSESGSLQLTYSPDAQGERPLRLFLKLVNADTGDGEYFGSSEVNYYLRDYVDVPDAPLLRCYDGRYSAAIHRYHLLLEDVSATHKIACDQPPTLEYGLALAEAFAILHGRWWGAERLAEAKAPLHDAAHIRRWVAIGEPGVDHIVGPVASELQPHWPAAMRDVFARHPQAMIDRTGDLNGFTIMHGDAGCYNIMVPREGELSFGVRPLYLIDRQPFDWGLTTWLGAYDLAYAIAMEWDVEARRQWEQPILRHYHQTLIQRGVQGYSWEQLWDDYRLCVAMGVYIAVEYCRGEYREDTQWVWLPMLQKTLIACDDLNCAELYM
jgi:hypothetical protein